MKFENVSASSWNADTTYSDYGYKCAITLSNVTASCFATVTFGMTEAVSGNYAPVCETYVGGVYIWGKVSEAITISSIVIEVF